MQAKQDRRTLDCTTDEKLLQHHLHRGHLCGCLALPSSALLLKSLGGNSEIITCNTTRVTRQKIAHRFQCRTQKGFPIAKSVFFIGILFGGTDEGREHRSSESEGRDHPPLHRDGFRDRKGEERLFLSRVKQCFDLMSLETIILTCGARFPYFFH